MTDEEMAEDYTNNLLKGVNCTIGNPRAKQINSIDVEEAFLAGLKAGRHKWHKVADGDLPKHEVNVLVLHNVQCIDIAHYNYDYKEWHFTDSIVREVIAWCEIPKYTEE
jgi:hypothetical protein